jgi:hypothetical protein
MWKPIHVGSVNMMMGELLENKKKQRVRNEKGSVLVVSMVSLVGLLAVGSVAVLASQRTMRVASHERFQAGALLAAESGINASMDFLAQIEDPSVHWQGFVQTSNIDPTTGRQVGPQLLIPGNTLKPGESGSLFTTDSGLWFEATILNNPDDPGFADTPVGDDGILVIRSVGHGPNGATVTLEAEVGGGNISGGTRPCATYAQAGLFEDGAGRTDCLGTVDGAATATMAPGS